MHEKKKEKTTYAPSLRSERETNQNGAISGRMKNRKKYVYFVLVYHLSGTQKRSGVSSSFFPRVTLKGTVLVISWR